MQDVNQGIIDPVYLKTGIIMTILQKKGLFSNQPMLSMPFIDWFNSYDFSEFFLVEFGSGYSTNFFADRVNNVVSFETNKSWYEYIQTNKKNNVEYNLISPKDLDKGIFDLQIKDKTIVLVDSASSRYLLSENIFKIGKPDMLFLDNSEWYPNTSKLIYGNGYTEIPFWGLRFGENYESCTSVFINNNFILPEKKYSFKSSGSIQSSLNAWDTRYPQY